MRNKLVMILASSALLASPASAMSFGEFLDHMVNDAKSIFNGEAASEEPVDENGTGNGSNGENGDEVGISDGSIHASNGGASASISNGSIEASANGASASISGGTISATANGTNVSIGAKGNGNGTGNGDMSE